MEEKKKGMGRGFASMSPERRKEVAQLGGKKAHELGKAHKWTPEEASRAGKKGTKHKES
ncbi:MAG: general stress protein [Smithella sp.]